MFKVFKKTKKTLELHTLHNSLVQTHIVITLQSFYHFSNTTPSGGSY